MLAFVSTFKYKIPLCMEKMIFSPINKTRNKKTLYAEIWSSKSQVSNYLTGQIYLLALQKHI